MVRHLMMLVFLTLSLAACERQTHSIHYEVSGTSAEIGVTYRNATGATEQRNITESWSYDFQSERGEWVSVRASNHTLENTTVGCRVTIDGVLFREATSEGALKFADCSGLIPFPTPTSQTP